MKKNNKKNKTKQNKKHVIKVDKASCFLDLVA